MNTADWRAMTPEDQGRVLIAWLETKDPDEEYVYMDLNNCAMAQFFTAQGFMHVSAWPGGFQCSENGEMVDVPVSSHFDLLAIYDPAGDPTRTDQTFGGYLYRLRAHLSDK